jgi:methionyl-tRNA synthetase
MKEPTKLTLGIEEKIRDAAHELSQATGKSIGAMFSEFITSRSDSEKKLVEVIFSKREHSKLVKFAKEHGLDSVETIIHKAALAHVGGN